MGTTVEDSLLVLGRLLFVFLSRVFNVEIRYTRSPKVHLPHHPVKKISCSLDH